MTEQEAKNHLYDLWENEEISNNFTEDHSDFYKAVIEIDGNEFEYNEFNKISEDTMILGTSLTWIKQ
jgi:hypothetical protein